MTYLSQNSLQQAVFSCLNDDATLTALITGIFDQVPQGTNYPYITFGDTAARDWSNLVSPGTDQHFILNIYSRESGRKQTACIMERIVTLLNNATLTIPGQTVEMLRFESSATTLQDDGITWRGILGFRALLTVS